MFDVNKVRQDFPILQRQIHDGKQLVYLDSAASSQKPLAVIEAMNAFYRTNNANIHRGVHRLAEESTDLYESARGKIAKFINAAKPRQIIYTRNTTESINLVAHSWGRKFLKAGDLVLLTQMEHHSNIVPWHMLATQLGILLEFIKITPDGQLDLEHYRQLLQRQPKLVSFTYMSNVLGTINPAKEMVAQAKAAGAVTLIDAAQAVPHFSVDVQDLDCDLMAFSSHKMLGPTGIGVLYGKLEILKTMDPFLGGGDMIKEVKFTGFTPNELPYKFEAGTPAIAEAVGFGAAIDYLEALGMQNVDAHEHDILAYALGKISEVPDIKVMNTDPKNKGGVIAFTLGKIHPHDVAQILDRDGIAVRAGHHCAQPLHEIYGIPASSRASFYIYTTRQEVDALVAGLHKVRQYFKAG